MSLDLSITADKQTINLGETVTVTYSCAGAYDCTIQSDSMTNPITFGTGDVDGNLKFLPVVSGDFTVTLTALGVVSQRLGVDNQSNTETNTATVTITVA
jgi:hypothetical protein